MTLANELQQTLTHLLDEELRRAPHTNEALVQSATSALNGLAQAPPHLPIAFAFFWIYPELLPADLLPQLRTNPIYGAQFQPAPVAQELRGMLEAWLHETFQALAEQLPVPLEDIPTPVHQMHFDAVTQALHALQALRFPAAQHEDMLWKGAPCGILSRSYFDLTVLVCRRGFSCEENPQDQLVSKTLFETHVTEIQQMYARYARLHPKQA